MLLLETERFVLETTLALLPMPHDAPNFTLRECIPELKTMINNGQAIYNMRHGRAQLRIVDCNEVRYGDDDKGAITFLLKFTDSDASDPSFSHLETGATRTVEKDDGEGLSVTAHLTVETHPINEAMPNVYNAVLEEVHGINKTNVSSALTHMLKECTNFEYIDENTKRRKKCRPRVKLDINAGHKLEELMNKGFVAGFKAVKYRAENRLDDEGDLEIQEESIVMRSKKKRGQAAIDLIKKAAQLANAQQYSRLMVRYQDDNKKQKTFNISTREENFSDGLFGKSEKILLANTIQQCEECIHEELSEKMIDYLLKAYA